MKRATFRLRWWRKARGLREKRFVEAHRDNIYAWRKRWEEWPEMATSGPWAGIAEDLTEEPSSALSLSGETKQALTWACLDMSRREVGACTRLACVGERRCAYRYAGDLT